LTIRGLKEREKRLNESGFIFIPGFDGSESNKKNCDMSDGGIV